MTGLFKVSGGGNDFLAVVESESEPSPSAVAAWCRRGLSLGADGLFTLRRVGDTVHMEYRNADGAPARLCLNATRCAARLAFELGWAESEIELATGAGPVRARKVPGVASSIALELAPPATVPAPLTLALDGVSHEGWLVEVGVPHFVLLWPSTLATAPVESLGPALRHHPALGESGANVDLVRFPDRHRLEIRTFERGVEAETLACGSGVLAAVAVGLHLGLAELPVTALTLGGFELRVEGEAEGGVPTRWNLSGDARLIARLELSPEAEVEPPPPRWSE